MRNESRRMRGSVRMHSECSLDGIGSLGKWNAREILFDLGKVESRPGEWIDNDQRVIKKFDKRGCCESRSAEGLESIMNKSGGDQVK